jgi:uncharacterized membrane protein YhaH (DUF805 family)
MKLSNPFTFSGKISRGYFTVAFLGLFLVPLPLFVALYTIFPLFGDFGFILLQILLMAGSVAAFAFMLSIVVRRAHDIGYSTSEAILRFVIPIINIIFIFRLFFSPAGAKQNGEKVEDVGYTSFDQLEHKAEEQSNQESTTTNK